MHSRKSAQRFCGCDMHEVSIARLVSLIGNVT